MKQDGGKQFDCNYCKWQLRHDLVKGQQCACVKNRGKNTSDCDAALLRKHDGTCEFSGTHG